MLKEKYLGYTAGEQVNEAIEYYQKDQLDCLSLFNQIAIVGDSLTVGHVDRYTVYSKDGNNKIVGATGGNATPDSNWPACLAKQYPGMSIHTFGLSGRGFHDWNSTFSSDINTYISQEGFPQLFIIALGANDITDYLPGDNSDIVDKYYTTSQLTDSNTNISAVKYASNLVRFIQEKTTMTSGSESGKVYTKIIFLGYPSSHADTKLYYASYQNPRSGNIDDYSTALKNMCEEMGVMYVDTSEDPYFSSDEFISTINYNHNNGVGYAGMAAAYARAINKCIADNGGRYPSQESKDTVNVTYETGYFSDCNYAFATSDTKLNIESNPIYRAISEGAGVLDVQVTSAADTGTLVGTIKVVTSDSSTLTSLYAPTSTDAQIESGAFNPSFNRSGTNLYCYYYRVGNLVQAVGGLLLPNGATSESIFKLNSGLPYTPVAYAVTGIGCTYAHGSIGPKVVSVCATDTSYTTPQITLEGAIGSNAALIYNIQYITEESFKNQ